LSGSSSGSCSGVSAAAGAGCGTCLFDSVSTNDGRCVDVTEIETATPEAETARNRNGDGSRESHSAIRGVRPTEIQCFPSMRESTGTEKETEARRFLKKREGRVASGEPVLPRVDRIRYEEVAADLRRHYEATGVRDLEEFTRREKHLGPFFGARRVAAIGQPDVDAYVVKRQEQGVVGATIRRELGTLTRMLRLAYQNGKVFRLPLFRKPKRARPGRGSSRQISIRPFADGCQRISRSRWRSRTPTAGGCRARC
jgi:hypothetical protein